MQSEYFLSEELERYTQSEVMNRRTAQGVCISTHYHELDIR